MKKITALLILVGSLSIGCMTASAQTNYATAGDAFLGFEDTTQNLNYLIDLGSASNLSSFTNLNISSDLTTVFGASWASNANLKFGLFGINSGKTQVWSSVVNGATAPVKRSSGALATTYTHYLAMETAFNNDVAASPSQFLTYGVQMNVGSGNDVGFGSWSGNTPSANGATAFAVYNQTLETGVGGKLDIYGVTSSTQTLINTWLFGSNGVVSVYSAQVNTNVWSSNSGNLSAIGITNGSTLVMSGSGGLVTNNSQVASLNGITFSNAATGSYNLSGNGVSITNGIVNNSTSSQTNSLAITLGGSQSLNAASGNLTIAGNITNSGYTLTIDGANATTVSGSISGVGGLTKIGTGTATLTAADSFNGSTLVNAGTLLLSGGSISNSAVTVGTNATFGGVGSAGAVTVNGGGTLTATGALNMASLTLQSNSATRLTLSSTNSYGSLNASGAVVFAGNLTLDVAGLYSSSTPGIFNLGTNNGASGNFQAVDVLYNGLDNQLVYWANEKKWQLWVNGPSSYYLGLNMNNGTFTVVPEPSTYAMSALGVSAIALRIMRRRRKALQGS